MDISKLITVGFLILQAGLFAIGLWQVTIGTPLMVIVGVFNIVVNIIFGCVNIRKITR